MPHKEDFPVVVEESTMVHMVVGAGEGIYTLSGPDEDGEFHLRQKEEDTDVFLFFPAEDLAALCRLFEAARERFGGDAA